VAGVTDIELHVEDGAEPVFLGPGLVVRSPIQAIQRDAEGFDLIARIEPQHGRLVITNLMIQQRPGGPPVTTDQIRSLPLTALAQEAARLVEVAEFPTMGQLTTADFSPEHIARLVAAGPVEETLNATAWLYRRALVMGEPPARTVQRTFDITRSRADRWVSMARQHGLIGPPEGPGRAGA
jgi:hypothetical protein